MVQPLWKTAGQFLKNLKLKLSYDPEILLLGIYSRYQNHVHTQKKENTYTSMFTTALFIKAKKQKQPKCPSTDVQIF